MLRRRGPGQRALQQIKQLDAFGRVQEAFVETTPVGGSISLLVFLLAAWLFCSEIVDYLDSRVVFKFLPDAEELDAKLKINVDITVATPCTRIGVDVLDSTAQSAYSFGELKTDATWFALEPDQRAYFDSLGYANSHLSEQYHAVAAPLWKSARGAFFGEMPPRRREPRGPHDACRIHGELVLNKVAGNLHVTAGKTLHFFGDHVHLTAFDGPEAHNFSHRINRLSFGDPAPGLVYPLEGDERFSDSPTALFQYFLDVVPTEVDTAFSQIKTYQYSAKELVRAVNHRKGSHGVPGVYFKYDIAPLRLRVSQERDNVVQFGIRLFSIVGGIYIMAGWVNSMIVGGKKWWTGRRGGGGSGSGGNKFGLAGDGVVGGL